jgi:predicted transcriptional regulator
MLGNEVAGWRVLAVLLLLLTIPSIYQSDEINDSWSDYIENNGVNDSEQTADAQSERNETSEPEASALAGDEAESDDAEFAQESAEIADSPPANEPVIESGVQEIIFPATQIVVLTMMAIMAVGLITSTTTAIIVSESARYSILLALLGPILAITNRGERGVFTRGRILGFIEAHPGIHFSALKNALGLGNGVTAHHIQILEKEGRIITWLDSKVRRFATSGIDQTRLKELQSPATGMQIAILEILSESGNIGIKSGDLRTKLQTSRQLLSYHMKHLKEREIVESVGKGRATKWVIREKGKSLLKNSTHLSDIG